MKSDEKQREVFDVDEDGVIAPVPGSCASEDRPLAWWKFTISKTAA